MKKHNFSAGPSILPQEVIQRASEGIVNFENMNLSVLEISHRSPQCVNLFNEAVALVKELLEVPDTHEVLFLQGGASMQFYMSALNLLKKKAAYVNTGAWSAKAIKEAKKLGEVVEVASSKDKNYSYIPKNIELDADVEYLHYTSNNTIFGTQFKDLPTTKVPLVADMSSDIFSKPIDVSKFDLIYAGAQKNLGPAGVTLVIVKKEALGNTGRDIPSMLDYQIMVDKESMFNTPPVFATYVSKLTLEWLKENGGIAAMAAKNQAKSAKLYAEIDSNPLFKGTANTEDRSDMNVCFVLEDDSKAEAFAQLQKEAGIEFLKGHRSVGGYRASIYNAMPESSIDVLISIMQNLQNK